MKFKLYDYLSDTYEPGELIFLEDLDVPMTRNNLRQRVKYLCSIGKLRKCDTGIYTIPKISPLVGEVTTPPDLIVYAKYIARGKKVFGYLSGANAANLLGLSTQIPVKDVIVTNNTKSRCQEIQIGYYSAYIKCARTEITDENVEMLQLLDTIKDIHVWPELSPQDAAPILRAYIQKRQFKLSTMLDCIKEYPAITHKNLIEMGLYNVFTQ